jgi:hypothetical protein
MVGDTNENAGAANNEAQEIMEESVFQLSSERRKRGY